MVKSEGELDTAEASDAITRFGEVVLRDPVYQDVAWHGIALAIYDSDAFGWMYHGYLYTEDGDWYAESPDNDDEVMQALAELRSATSAAAEPGWKACLLQILRQDMRVNIDFEYVDARRWKVGPANLYAQVEELRPVKR